MNWFFKRNKKKVIGPEFPQSIHTKTAGVLDLEGGLLTGPSGEVLASLYRYEGKVEYLGEDIVVSLHPPADTDQFDQAEIYQLTEYFDTRLPAALNRIPAIVSADFGIVRDLLDNHGITGSDQEIIALLRMERIKVSSSGDLEITFERADPKLVLRLNLIVDTSDRVTEASFV